MEIINNSKVANKRQSNFELLRLFSMFLIVAGHLYIQSGSFATENITNLIFNHIFGHGHRIAVNAFLILGCYFLAEKSFRSDRFLRIWLLDFFYTGLITTIMYLKFPGTVSRKGLFWAFFPILGFEYNHWYVTIWLVLLLLAPFLNSFFKYSREVQKKCLLILLILVCGFLSIYRPEDVYLDGLGWFVIVYLMVGYYKKFLKDSVKGKYRWLILSISIYAILVFFGAAPSFGLDGSFMTFASKWANQYINDYKSFPNLLSAFSLFIFFSKINIGSVKWVNSLSSSTLAVYVVHQTICFFPFLWTNILRLPDYYNKTIWPLYSMGCIAFLFIAIIAIDKVRINLLEPIAFRSKTVKICGALLEEWYAPVDNREIKHTNISTIKIKETIVCVFLSGLCLYGAYYNYTRDIPINIFLSGDKWNASEWINEGISISEGEYTWTNGNIVSLNEIHFRNKSEHHLHIEFANVFNNNQTVQIFLNDIIIFENVYSSGAEVDVVLPGGIDSAVIRIGLPNAASPAQLGQSQDDRMIALQLTNVSIT